MPVEQSGSEYKWWGSRLSIFCVVSTRSISMVKSIWEAPKPTYVALLFVFFGASVWVLRSEPVLLSLVLIFLTWKLAAVLAEMASLPSSARCYFMNIAALLAAIAPLYDTVITMRLLGGYVETFVLILLLFIAALRLI